MRTDTTKIELSITFHVEDENDDPIGCITSVERVLLVDGKRVYISKISLDLYLKEKSILIDFERWLTLNEEAQPRKNISGKRRNKLNPIRHRWFQGFNFKKKFLDIFNQKFFLSHKASV